MTNGWTGGQYSLFRGLLAAYLLARFAGLARSGEPVALAVGLLGVALAFVVAVGGQDRPAALALVLGWGFLAWKASVAWPSALALVFVLAAHAALPPAPYGSWSARGRADPSGSWHVPARIHLAAWVALSATYLARGALALHRGPGWPGLPEVLFTPVAALPALRPWAWMAMLVWQFASGRAEAGIVLLHLFTFDPAWVRPVPAAPSERLFYDGSCGLCHRAVRFLLAEDSEGRFRFAPLDSEAFRSATPEALRAALPDSLVLETAEGRLLTRSAAVLHALARLGGLWRLLGALARLVPPVLRDAAYDAVARVRYRVFARPAEACPVVPAALRARFDR